MDDRNVYSTVLMDMMVERLKLAGRAAYERRFGAGLQPLETSCRACAAACRCEAWLALDAAGDALGYRAFCPNAAAFDRWRSASPPEGR